MPRRNKPNPELIDPSEVRNQLERILAFSGLQSNLRRRDMLAFIVEEALAGRSSQIKATSIAMEVFQRGPDFDQQSDPVVRLEARKLRRDLDNYYAGEGREDPIRIAIPKGGYVPEFAWLARRDAERATPEDATPASVDGGKAEGRPAVARATSEWSIRRPAFAAAAGITVMICFALVLFWSIGSNGQNAGEAMPSRGVTILIEAFDARDADDQTVLIAQGLSHEVAAALLRFPDLRVHLMPAQKAQEAEAGSESHQSLQGAFTVTGAVWREAGDVFVRAELSRRADQQILWSDRYAEGVQGRTLTEIQDEISSRIASVTGQQYGHAMKDVRTDLEDDSAAPSLRGFACVASAQIYRRTYSALEYPAARECLEETVRTEPDYARAWAMLTYLRNDAARFGHDTERTREEAFDLARSAGLRALNLDPHDTDALQAMSHVEQYTGDLEQSIEYARRAVDVNPNDPAALANLGIRYHIAGRYDLAVPLMQQAIDMSVAPPPFYFHVLAADHLIKQEWEDMLSAAQRASLDGWSFGQAMLAIANNELSNGRAAAAALTRLAELDPLLSESPRAWLESHQASPALLEAVVAGLARANAAPKNGLP
ncbi:tetratricopeptide repeat protein [Roseobacter ponti]|uniref:Adenylate cyclase n=1 Tax=Roseobacter ponti TaxID=1891787 RepID=A0A858SS13_9RHOB|nr:hypothetical protein [Roseobacter ponti]QJF51110.1 hypothetical protein G3256_08020 [Roseobacter ponti]